MATAATSTNDRLNLYVSKCELKEILLTIINAVHFRRLVQTQAILQEVNMN